MILDCALADDQPRGDFAAGQFSFPSIVSHASCAIAASSRQVSWHDYEEVRPLFSPPGDLHVAFQERLGLEALLVVVQGHGRPLLIKMQTIVIAKTSPSVNIIK